MNDKFLLITFLIFISFHVGAQEFTTRDIAESEAKAAAPRINNTTTTHSYSGNYDLTYQRLDLDVDPSESSISGTITSHFIAEADLSEISFDLNANMNVTAVEQDNSGLSFTHQEDQLVISLDQTLPQGTLDSLSVTYSGTPSSSGFGTFEQSTHNGNGIVWTLSEPFGAKAWWPCKQYLSDKIDSLDIYLNYPEFNSNNQENVGVANGLKVSESVANGTKTTYYHHGFPIPAYLVAFAVTNYTTYSNTVPNNGNPFEIVNHVYPENASYAQSQTAVTADIMEFFSDKFGEYPYASEQYGHAQFGWGGGMEHTTISFMGSFSRHLIAHELGHQWFGDKVTCGSWQDVWLNEGFASYMEGMVVQEFDGEAAFRAWRENKVESTTNFDAGSVYVEAEDTTSVNTIFNSRLSYDKAAMVLHMLRKKLGDDDFFQALRNYLTDPDLSFSYAKTPDLRAALENQSGMDLNEFFQDWVYGEGYPSFDVSVSQNDSGQLSINVSEDQSDYSVDFFEVGLPVRFNGSYGQVLDTVLQVDTDDQNFNIDAGFYVLDFEIDPETDIISRDNTSSLNVDEPEIQKFKVYPNPAKDKVFIEQANTDFDRVKIFNISGQLIAEKDFSKTINISKLSSGIYFFEFSGNTAQKRIKRLVIE